VKPQVIVVNHLTRMSRGYICVAGFDVESEKHVRPVLAKGQRLKRDLFRREGGPFDLGWRIDLGDLEYAGQPPEVEDWLFDPAAVNEISKLDSKDFWRKLEQLSVDNLPAAFGDTLEPRGTSFVVAQGKGVGSLACVEPTGNPQLQIDGWGSLRCSVTLDGRDVTPSVTDIRLCEADHKTVKKDVVASVNLRLTSERCILSVGLTRPFRASGDNEYRHWLQVNNIHLEKDVYWS
jgi:hypothetical protein